MQIANDPVSPAVAACSAYAAILKIMIVFSSPSHSQSTLSCAGEVAVVVDTHVRLFLSFCPFVF